MNTFIAILLTSYAVCVIASSSMKKTWMKCSHVIFIINFLILSGVIGQRWIAISHPPFQSQFETFVLLAWCLHLSSFLIFQKIKKAIPIGSLAVVMTLLVTLVFSKEELMFPSALQSVWFVPHVVLYFIGYAGMGLAALFAGAAFFSRSFSQSAHRLVCWSYPFLSFGLVLGALWAKETWGDYWGWDPKETWALLTWTYYLWYFHLKKRGDIRTLVLNGAIIFGFFIVLFTFLGLPILPSARESLHVYR